MTPKQFQRSMIGICGKERGNQSRMAALLGLHRSTIGRYLKGEEDIPRVVALVVKAIEAGALEKKVG